MFRTRTPTGVLTCSGSRWNMRRPGRAADSSTLATSSAPCAAEAEHRRRTLHAHVHGAGRLADHLERWRACSGTRAERAAIAPPPSAPPRATRAAARGRTTAASVRCAGTPGWPSAEREPAPCARAVHAGTRRAAAAGVADRRASGRARCSPSSTSEIIPVSSDTTTATESFSSVRPIAARCRDPSSRLRRGLTVSGRKHAAAAIRSSWMITAPS